MNTTHTRMAILITLLAGLMITSCAKSGSERATCDTQYPERSGAGGSYQYQARTETFTYNVTGEMSSTRLHMVFEQNEGGVTWMFTDPVGEVQWEGEYAEAGVFDETRDFPPILGEWRLEIDGQDGSGSYEHCWMAR